MTKLFFPAALLGQLAMAGCAQIGMAPTIAGDRLPIKDRMFTIASRYEQDRREGGMAGVAEGIAKCYNMATSPVVVIYGVRDCLILDYVASLTVMTGRRQDPGLKVPFLQFQTASARWDHYAPMAQFDSRQRMIRYLNDSNDIVQVDLGQINVGPLMGYHPLYSHLSKPFMGQPISQAP